MKWCSLEAEVIRLRYLLAAKTIENEQLKSALREDSSTLKPLCMNTLKSTRPQPDDANKHLRSASFNEDSKSAVDMDKLSGVVIGKRLTDKHFATNERSSSLEPDEGVGSSVTNAQSVNGDHGVEDASPYQQSLEIDPLESFEECDSVECLLENRRFSRSRPVDSLGISLLNEKQVRREKRTEKCQSICAKESSDEGVDKEFTMESIHQGIMNLTANIRRLGISTDVKASEAENERGQDKSKTKSRDCTKAKDSCSDR